MHLRHQLAVYSPISVRAVAAAAAAALGGGRDSVELLEGLLRREFSADDVLLCGSGTQALQLAIESARAEGGRDTPVALPAFSCFDVASAAIGAGAPVILYDLDPLSLSPDLESLERALAAGARIVVVAPLYGIPADWDAIEDLASSFGATLIEDAAQGHGATHRRRPVGSLGDISTVSFGRGKGWTGGSGGAVLFRRGRKSPATLRGAGSTANLRTTAVLAAQWGLGRPSIYGLPRSFPALELGETVYRAPREPTSISRAAAAALLANRDAALREAERRRANAQTIRARIADHPALREVVSRSPNATAGHLRFAVLASGGLRGFGGVWELASVERLGIAGSYPKQLGELPQLAPLIVGAVQMPGAARLVQQLVTLPVHSLGSKTDFTKLVERVNAYSTE